MAGIFHTLPLALLAAGVALAGAATLKTFDERDMSGSWVLSAQGAIVGTTMPLSLMGVVEFRRDGKCSLSGMINAGGLTWPTEAVGCGFALKSDGTGSLAIRLPAGPVAMPTIPMSFVIVDANEIRTMATDDVSLTGVLRKREH